MKKQLLTISVFSILAIGVFVLPSPASAHQPRLVETSEITVVDPAVSKAYYGTLAGSPHTYTVHTTEPFNLYVGILMPYAEDSKKDVQAEIHKGTELIQVIGGKDADWKSMFEFFGQSTYWDGGEYKARVEAGTYIITVSSAENDSKYSLAIGEIEAFNGSETMNALKLIPELKSNFFNESPISFIKSPFGWGYILIMYIAAFIFGLVLRFVMRKFSAHSSISSGQENIGKYDRAIRLAIALGLLLIAITTTWSPWLLFFSGFALFEATFSWCGLCAALGRNTCPTN